MNDYAKKDMTLRDIIKVIFRHKLVIITCFITIITSVYISLELRVPVYHSSVKILVSGAMQRDLDVSRNLGPGKLIATQMTLVRSRPILERTVKALNLHQRPLDHRRRNASRLNRILIDNEISKLKLKLENMTPNERQAFLFNRAINALAGNLTVYPEPETSIFYITISDYNANDAGLIANVLSRSYAIFDLEQQIAELQLIYGNKNETIIKLEKHIEHMKETLDGRLLSDIEAMGPATVKIITQAGPGTMRPMRPARSSAFIAAIVISMALGITLAFTFDFFDMTIKSSNDVRKFLNIPYLGSIPKRKASDNLLVDHSISGSSYDQMFQKLSHRLYIAMKEHNCKTVLIADAEEAEESAIIVANVGSCLSHKSGYKVLIIDADLRGSVLHDRLNISNESGIEDLIAGKTTLANTVHDLGSNLHYLPVGVTASNPVALLESAALSEIIKEARTRYEIVLVNCSDIKEYSDAVILSSYTDSVVFSINEGKVRRQIVQNAVDPFKQRDIKMLGVILNNHKNVVPEILYRLT